MNKKQPKDTVVWLYLQRKVPEKVFYYLLLFAIEIVTSYIKNHIFIDVHIQ